jgi:hypothetical protein
MRHRDMPAASDVYGNSYPTAAPCAQGMSQDGRMTMTIMLLSVALPCKYPWQSTQDRRMKGYRKVASRRRSPEDSDVLRINTKALTRILPSCVQPEFPFCQTRFACAGSEVNGNFF